MLQFFSIQTLWPQSQTRRAKYDPFAKKRDLGIPVKWSISEIWDQFDFLTQDLAMQYCLFITFRGYKFNMLLRLSLFANSYVSLSSICILRKRLNNFLLFFVAKYPLFYSTLAEQFDTFISLETLKTAEYISKVDFAGDQCFLQTGHLSPRKSIFSKRKSICFKIWIDKRNKCFFNPIFICCKLKPSRNLL